MRREGAQFPDLFRDQKAARLGFEEAFKSLVGKALQKGRGISSQPSRGNGGLINIGGEHLDFGHDGQLVHMLAQQDGQGIRFLAGGTAGDPHAYGAIGLLAGEQMGNCQRFQGVKGPFVAKKARHAD